MGFYCQIRCGEVDFSFSEWNKALKEILAMPIPEDDKERLIHPAPCERQCQTCIDVVIETKARNREKHGF